MKKKKLTEKQIQEALGADYSIKLKSGKEHGPLGWLHQMHEVQEIQRLRAKKYTCGGEANVKISQGEDYDDNI